MTGTRRVRIVLLALLLAGALLGVTPGSASAATGGPAAAVAAKKPAKKAVKKKPAKKAAKKPAKKKAAKKKAAKKKAAKKTPPKGKVTTRKPAPAPGPAPAPAPAPASWWRPAPGLTWQWQLSGPLDRSVAVQVYDIDAVEASAADVAALHAAGRKVICYVNVGAYEDWRPDAARFPAAVLGGPLDGWPGERWLDIRRWDVLGPILTARFTTCKDKGFDAVEPDNMDGYANPTGFPLTAADQLTFNRRLADLAHGLGLAVGLKNDVEQATALEPVFDFAVNESCVTYAECAELRPFVAAGKAVFHVEYALDVASFCPTTTALGFSSMRKRRDLDAWRQPCP